MPGTQQQYIYGVADLSLLAGLPTACQTLPIATTSLFNASTTTSSPTGTVAVGTGRWPVQRILRYQHSLPGGLVSSATDTNTTDANFGCYLYDGWLYSLRRA